MMLQNICLLATKNHHTTTNQIHTKPGTHYKKITLFPKNIKLEAKVKLTLSPFVSFAT